MRWWINTPVWIADSVVRNQISNRASSFVPSKAWQIYTYTLALQRHRLVHNVGHMSTGVWTQCKEALTAVDREMISIEGEDGS
jgi:hypothetical protein